MTSRRVTWLVCVGILALSSALPARAAVVDRRHRVPDQSALVRPDLQPALKGFRAARVRLLSPRGAAAFVEGELGDLGTGEVSEATVRPLLDSLVRPLGLSRGDLRFVRSVTDSFRDRHARYRQFRNGLEVVGGEVIVHAGEDGKVFAVNSTAFDGTGPDAVATVNAEAARTAALRRYGPGAAARDLALVYVIDAAGALHLAHRVRVEGRTANGTPLLDLVFVDAKSGVVVAVHPQVSTARLRIVYDGNQSTDTSTLPGTPVRIEGGQPSTDALANTHFDHMGRVYDCYQNTFNRDSWNGEGGLIRSTIHFGPRLQQNPPMGTREPPSAFWSSAGTQMVFRDYADPAMGQTRRFQSPAYSFDTTAHEFTHGVTQSTSNLTYSHESGALNEMMSEVFASICDAATAGETDASYKLHEEQYVDPMIAPYFMGDPKAFGSVDWWPDRNFPDPAACSPEGDESKPTFNDNCGVHTNSGIGILAFYLMAKGGKHPNNKTDIEVRPIGMEIARQIFYAMNVAYLSSNSNYAHARYASTVIASRAFGLANSIEVDKAWASVGVGDETPGSGVAYQLRSKTLFGDFSDYGAVAYNYNDAFGPGSEVTVMRIRSLVPGVSVRYMVYGRDGFGQVRQGNEAGDGDSASPVRPVSVSNPYIIYGLRARLLNAPPGMSICYQVLQNGIGWQNEVCDFALAGSEPPAGSPPGGNITAFRVKIRQRPAPALMWKNQGLVTTDPCVFVDTADPEGWGNNFLCTKDPIGLRRTKAVVPNHFNVPFFDPRDPAFGVHFLSTGIDYGYRWSHSGPFPNSHCLQIVEPEDTHTGADGVRAWDDNFLCADGAFAPHLESTFFVSRPGREIALEGEYFASNGRVEFSGATDAILEWTPTRIRAIVPRSFGDEYEIRVFTSGGQSNRGLLIVEPEITSVSPGRVAHGDILTIRGSDFGASRGQSRVEIGIVDVLDADYLSWSDTEIRARVPPTAWLGQRNVRILKRTVPSDHSANSNGVAVVVGQSCDKEYAIDASAFLEAEGISAQTGTRFQSVADAAASGGSYIATLPDSGDNFPATSGEVVQYKLDVVTAGTYRIWLRTFAPSQASDSVWVHLDNETPLSVVNATNTAWVWVPAGTARFIGAGPHALSIRMREDGTRLDKILITTSTTTPTGLGGTAATFCAAPATVLPLVAPGNGSVTLTWPSVSGATFYGIKRSTVSGGPYTSVGGLSAGGSPMAADVTAAGTLTFTDTGLTNGTLYYYVLTTMNDASSTDSPEVSARPEAPPEAPSNLIAVALSSTEIELMWQDHATNERQFELERKTGTAGTWGLVTTLGADVNRYVDGHLASNTEYVYRVRAVGSEASPYSNEASARTERGTCLPGYAVDGSLGAFLEAEGYTSPPAGTRFQRVSDAARSAGAYMQIAQGANGTANYTGAGTSPDHLLFTVNVTQGGAFYVWLLGSGPDTSSDSFWINLDGGTDQAVNGIPPAWTWVRSGVSFALADGTHTLRIKNREDGARVDKVFLTRSTSTTPPAGQGGAALTPCAVPAPPTELTAVALDRRVDLSWTGSTAALRYNVKRGTASGGPYTTLASPTSTSHVDLTVTNGVQYFYVVTAENDAGESGPSNEAPARPDITVNAPSALGATARSATAVDLAWSDNSSNETAFRIERKTGAAGFAEVATVGTNVSTFGDTGLAIGTTYTYRVRAAAGTRLSTYSNEASVRTSGPVLSSIAPASGPVGTVVTITGQSFGSTQGTAVLTLNGQVVSVAPSDWTSTSIRFTVPSGATSGAVTVRVGEVTSNGMAFTVNVACANRYNVNGAADSYLEAERFTGTAGTRFRQIVDAARSNGAFMEIAAGANTAGNYTTSGSASPDHLVLDLNVTGGGSFNVWILVSGPDTGSDSFWVGVDAVTDVSVNGFPAGWTWVRAATSFTLNDGPHTLRIKNREDGARIDKILLTKAATTPSGLGGTALFKCDELPPAITSLSPASGAAGASVTIFGQSFGTTQGSSTVRFNGILAGVQTWSNGQIGVIVPSGATSGSVVVTVAGRASNGAFFTVTTTQPPVVTTLTPSFGPVGTSVTIAGSNFGPAAGPNNLVRFGGVLASPTSWSDTQIVVPVPTGATSGPVLVWAGTQGTMDKTFSVTTPMNCSPYTVDGNVNSYIEAEGFNMFAGMFGRFQRYTDGSASRGALMSNGIGSFPSPGTSEDQLVYRLNVVNGGTFTLWLLTSAFPDAARHGFWIAVDEGPDQAFDLSTTSAVWTRHGSTLSLPNGARTLRIKSRDPETKVDKLLLTKNGSFVPGGIANPPLPNCGAPAPPIGVTAAAGTASREICVSWTPSSNAARYNLSWGTSSRAYDVFSIDHPDTRQCYSMQSSGVRYFFGVRAVNAGGESGFSSEASAVAP